jgi:hypothetical protein
MLLVIYPGEKISCVHNNNKKIDGLEALLSSGKPPAYQSHGSEFKKKEKKNLSVNAYL